MREKKKESIKDFRLMLWIPIYKENVCMLLASLLFFFTLIKSRRNTVVPIFNPTVLLIIL